MRGPGRRAPIFYNLGMAVDRDLGVAVVRALAARWPAGARAWEMTAATGVRGLRLVAETDGISELVASEVTPGAVRVLTANAARYADRGARAVAHDARRPIAAGAFDLVDLDPYGSPVPFLDSAVDALHEDGVLAVTATDLRVLAGVERGACERRYGARPLRGRLAPEAGLRILLAAIDGRLRARGRQAEPLLAYVRDHHLRAYLRSRPAGATPAPVQELDPGRWPGPPLRAPGPYGPLWVGPLFDAPFVRSLGVPATAACPRALGHFLDRLREEAEVDVPFFYEPNELARTLHLARPPPIAALLAALAADGHRAGRSHVRESAVRTTAPWARVDAVVRALGTGQSQNDRVRA